VIGVGFSYKLGWGQDIQHIKMSGQGASIRNYADVKLKGSFWVSGGFEMNFRSEIKNIDELKNQSGWQQSGLIGISKVVAVKANVFKNTKVQALWDFLSYQQIPRTPPLIFRISYGFK
jgi:hypothetical protein